MVEPHIQLKLMDTQAEDSKLEVDEPTTLRPKPLKWWMKLFLFSILVLAGQATAILLGRLYFHEGGKGKWVSTLVQVVGFPALLPFYYALPTKTTPKHTHNQDHNDEKPSPLKLGAVYISLGLFLALDCMLYTIGLQYLPVSTFSLICALQLAFNALFAFLLNAQKITPYIANSLVILTISSTLLVFQDQSSSNTNGITKGSKYIIGFLCTVSASAIYGLQLSLTQLAFEKVIKRYELRAILDMLVYENLVATCVVLLGLFTTGEWKTLKEEMEGYKLGKVSYVMTLTWIALSWQIFAVGALKLITEMSSLFSNVIGTLGLPVVPLLAVFIFHDQMNGIKVVAMVLAIWGFISYAFQCFLDNQKITQPEQGNIIV